jgi:hypothetical protein
MARTIQCEQVSLGDCLMMKNPGSASQRSPFTYEDELALVRFLLDRLERTLAGRNTTRVLQTSPSDHCHLGVLGPHDRDTEQPEPLDPGDEASDTDLTSRQNADITSHTQRQETQEVVESGDLTLGQSEQIAAEHRGSGRDSTRRPPSSLGLEVVVGVGAGDDVAELMITGSFAVYTRHFPTYEEQLRELGTVETGADDPHQDDEFEPSATSITSSSSIDATPTTSSATVRNRVSLVEAFVRHTVEIPAVRVQIDPLASSRRLTDNGLVQGALDQVLDKAATEANMWTGLQANATIPVKALESEASFNQYLRSIAKGNPIRPPLKASLDIRLTPTQDSLVGVRCYLRNDTPRELVTRYLDQYHILADVQIRVTLIRGQLHPVELLPIPTDYQFDRRVWALGHGASAVVSTDHRFIHTEALARYEQPRKTTRKQPTALFEHLIGDPVGTLEAIRQGMVEYAEQWQLEQIDQNQRALEPQELEQCQNDLTAFREEISRFAAGIGALTVDERLRRAFIAMNRVFLRTSVERYDRWHLFQIVFIVTQLPALVIREGIKGGAWPQGIEHTWHDALDWVDVLWFSTGGGKTEAYLGLISCAALYDRLRGKRFGVTAWLRFPLRMLSVQQLERAVRVLWETEKERQSLLADQGQDSDPIALGYLVGEGSTPNSLRMDNSGRWPFDRIENDKATRDRLLLVSNCPACRGEGTVKIKADRPRQRIRHICSQCGVDLPIFVSDDEVYRFLPTVIIGTIDKMASIAYNARFSMIWGGAAWLCELPEHGYGMGDWCITNCPTNPRRGRTQPPRRTPISAKDPAPSLHIQDELHLLQEELGAFAGHYETLVRSCEEAVGGLPPKVIAATATIEGFEHQTRHVYGVPNARRFPGRGFDLLETFYTTADRNEADPEHSVKTMRLYAAFRPPHLHAADAASLCTRLLHEELIHLYDNPYEATAWLPTARTEEDVRALLYYYIATLTYVGSKAYGLRVRHAVEREAGRLRPGNTRDLTTEFLSGDSSLATISQTVRKIETPPSWTDERTLDATIATSVISHGVDLERFNIMVMDGIPEETAAYIQASSRSGRQHVGLVLAVLASYSIRSSSIYHRFNEYHAHLERLISPIPINRFAKYAVKRTAPGVLIGTVLGRYGALAHMPNLANRSLAAELLTPERRSSLPFKVDPETLSQAVKAALALKKGVYPDSLELAMEEALEEQIQRFIYSVRGSHRDKLWEVVEPRPMTSLRDVDVGVGFRPEEEVNWYELKWFDVH